MSKLSQVLKLLAILETHHIITKKELAEKLETNVRNIRIYLDALKDAGIQVEGISGCRGGHFLLESSKLFPPNLDMQEYTALLFAEKLLTQKNGFVMENELKTAIAKIRWALGDQITKINPPIPEEFIFLYQSEDQTNIKNTFELVNKALRECFAIEFFYYSPSKDETLLRKVYPYGIIYRNNSWYLVGFCCVRQDMRTFKMVRIKNIVILDEKFRYPVDFNIDDYMQESFGIFQGQKYKIEVQFFHPASVFVQEKIWIANQKILQLKDGSIIFKARVKGLTEIKNWIMSFGHLALVRSPQELIDEVRNEAEKILERYK